jgi:hypothetical protein
VSRQVVLSVSYVLAEVTAWYNADMTRKVTKGPSQSMSLATLVGDWFSPLWAFSMAPSLRAYRTAPRRYTGWLSPGG